MNEKNLLKRKRNLLYMRLYVQVASNTAQLCLAKTAVYLLSYK